MLPEQEGVTLEFVAPVIGGVAASDGSRIGAGDQIDGGPSVLYDAVALLPSAAGASALARNPAARDFVTDAYAHCTLIGYRSEGAPLLEATGIRELLDDGFIELADGPDAAAGFVETCRRLRFWERSARSDQKKE